MVKSASGQGWNTKSERLRSERQRAAVPERRCWAGSWRWWRSQTSCVPRSGSRSSSASTRPGLGRGWCPRHSSDSASHRLGRNIKTNQAASHRVEWTTEWHAVSENSVTQHWGHHLFWYIWNRLHFSVIRGLRYFIHTFGEAFLWLHGLFCQLREIVHLLPGLPQIHCAALWEADLLLGNRKSHCYLAIAYPWRIIWDQLCSGHLNCLLKMITVYS